MKRILCFGDSNTWGFIPGSGKRYPEDIRWTGVAQKELGPSYLLIEDGINGRTTVFDNPYHDYMNGLKGLPYSLNSAKPLDLVVLMLGTNDLAFTDAFASSKGLSKLVSHILHADNVYAGPTLGAGHFYPDGAKLLLVSPILMHPDIAKSKDQSLRRGYEESLKFHNLVQALAEETGMPWMDAAEYGKASGIDCLHMSAEAHHAVGIAIAHTIRKIL